MLVNRENPHSVLKHYTHLALTPGRPVGLVSLLVTCLNESMTVQRKVTYALFRHQHEKIPLRLTTTS